MTTLNPLPPAGAAFMADLTTFLREEDADRFILGWQSFVVSGGLHGTGAGLTATPAPMVAFPNGIYVTESGGITYPNGAVSWVIADELTTGNVGSYIRVPGTHYLVATTGVQPAVPATAIPLMRVTTAGGAVTEVKDLRPLSPNRGIHAPGIAFSSQYPSLQAAIDALPDEGGTLFITPGTYVLTQTLRLGNGGAAHVSDRQGIVIVGLGAPFNAAFGYTTQPAVKLVWGGGAAPVVEVAGPLAGWGIRGLAIDGAGVATHGIRIVSAQYGTLADCCIIGATRAEVGCDTVTTFGGAPNTNVFHNRFSNVFCMTAGLFCMELGGSNPQAITEYNTFDNIFLVVAGNGTGLQLAACAGNVFTNVHVTCGAGAHAPLNFAYDNGHSNLWPNSNQFFGLEPHNKPIAQTGTPGGGLFPNLIMGLTRSTGAPIPEVEGVMAVYADPDGNWNILPSSNAAAAKPDGDVVVVSTPTNVHNLLPAVSDVADVGSVDYRWRLLVAVGGLVTPALTVAATPTTLGLANSVVLVNAAASAITLTLPSATTMPGKQYVIKKIDASGNAVTITPAGGETIDGGGAIAISTQWQTRTLLAEGTGWVRLDRP